MKWNYTTISESITEMSEEKYILVEMVKVHNYKK